MSPPNRPDDTSTHRVQEFWDQVWNAHDPDAADRYLTEDFVLIYAGEETRGRERYKRWLTDYLDKVRDLNLQVDESFQNAAGSRVAARWRITGQNNGFLDTPADQSDIYLTGTAHLGGHPVRTPQRRLDRTRLVGTAAQTANAYAADTPRSLRRLAQPSLARDPYTTQHLAPGEQHRRETP